MRLFSGLALALTLAVSSLPAHADTPAPMFRDPITNGAADPTLVYNPLVKQWWMFYTQRRANTEAANVAYCYGNPIGVAMSSDNGHTWVYKGTLALDFEPGVNTFWAPEVAFDGKNYHLFVTYIQGVRNDWGGTSRTAHYTSSDLWNWKFQNFANFGSNRVIDISAYQMPDKTWKLWFKDQANGGSISSSTSTNFINWKRDAVPAIAGGAQEGPKVFRFKDHYWMITDEWKGQRVYRSDDALKWERQGLILDVPGTRPQDTPQGAHADVVVAGGRAYIIYFTHPGRKKHQDDEHDEIGNIPYKMRRSVIQVAELIEKDGVLTCDRNAKFDINLPNS
jgi:hypothetical protein